jgi:hypothetical protein
MLLLLYKACCQHSEVYLTVLEASSTNAAAVTSPQPVPSKHHSVVKIWHQVPSPVHLLQHTSYAAAVGCAQMCTDDKPKAEPSSITPCTESIQQALDSSFNFK